MQASPSFTLVLCNFTVLKLKDCSEYEQKYCTLKLTFKKKLLE